MKPSTNKYILYIITVTLIAIVSIVTYFSFFKSREVAPQPTQITSTINEGTRRVFIKDIDIDSINKDIKKRIENALYEQSLYSNQGVYDLFTGVIHPESYSTTVAGDITSTSFLVDVNPINITYLVNVNKMPNDLSITIKCAPKEKQISDGVCKVADGIV